MSFPDKWICPNCGADFETEPKTCPLCGYQQALFDSSMSNSQDQAIDKQTIADKKNPEKRNADNKKFNWKRQNKTDTQENLGQMTLKQQNYFNEYIQKGNNSFASNDKEAGLNFYRKAYEVNPKDQNLLKKLGDYYFERKLLEKALFYYNKLLGINPKDQILLKKLADYHFERSQAEKALFYYNKLYEIDATLPDVAIRIEKLEKIMKDRDESLFETKNTVDNSASYSSSMEGLIEQGDKYYRNNDYHNARLNYEKALQMDPDNVNILGRMGDLKMKTMDLEKAVFYYNKVLKSQPNRADILEAKENALKTLNKIQKENRVHNSESSKKYICIRCKTEYESEPYICPRCGFSNTLAKQAFLASMLGFENMMMDRQNTYNEFFNGIEDNTLTPETLVKALNFMKKDGDLINSILTKSASKDESSETTNETAKNQQNPPAKSKVEEKEKK